MSIKNLFGTFRTLELLLFLPDDQFVSSSEIRKKFLEIKSGTLNAKLRKLKEEGLVEVLVKERLERAGDDKKEYKVSEDGKWIREELVLVGVQVLGSRIQEIVESKTASEVKGEKRGNQEIFNDFLMEFSEECAGMVEGDVLEEQHSLLKRMLDSYF